MKKIQNFTEGPIFGPLVKFALPVLFALFLQTMYGAVDLLIVGQFGTSADVSAVSTGSQIMNTITIVVTSLAMGLTILVGRKIGAGEEEEAGEIIGSGICLFAVIGTVISVVMVLMAKPVAAVMHAPVEAFDKTVSYVVICSAGTLFIVAYNLLGSIFRGIGDSKMPLITVMIACGMNIVGDLVLIAGLHMGTAGAAIATVFAQGFSVVLSILIIRRKKLPFHFTRHHIRFHKGYISKTLALGIPIALQELLVSISFLVITAIVNGMGLTASAGVGVAQKLCGFLMLVASAYMQSMSAFVAQNIGAGRADRARRALWCGVGSSLAVGAVMCVVTFFYGDKMAGIFARDPEVILAAYDYLKAYAVDCIFTAFLFCFIGYFNGCSCTVFVMCQGIIGAFGVRLPVSWIMSRQAWASLFHIGLATPASTVVQIILCGIYFSHLRKRQKREVA